MALKKTRRATVVARPPKARWNRPTYPLQLEAKYRASLLRLVDMAWAELRREVTPLLKGLSLTEGEREDAAPPTRTTLRSALSRAAGRISSRATPGRMRVDAQQLGQEVSAQNRRALREQFRKAMSIDVLKDEPSLRPVVVDFTRRNVALAKSLPDQLLEQVQQQLLEALEKGTRAEELEKVLEERHQVARSRARLIARDQVGKLTASLTEARHKALGVKKYVWRTMRDSRVRPSHAEREGRVYSYDDPPVDGHPGTPVADRCWAEPVLDGLLPGAD